MPLEISNQIKMSCYPNIRLRTIIKLDLKQFLRYVGGSNSGWHTECGGHTSAGPLVHFQAFQSNENTTV